MIVISLPPLSERVQWKQIAPPNPVSEIAKRLPCACKDGICACCTGMLLQALRSKGCLNLKYIADDFAFVFEMKMNNQVLYKNRVSGKNPAPICVNPPRFPFIQVCATIYDVYFFGRNVHACMEFGGYFEGFQLFNRNFDCFRMGSQGVRIVKPGEERPERPESSAGNATDAIIDAGDGIDEYDENLIRFEEQNPDLVQQDEQPVEQAIPGVTISTTVRPTTKTVKKTTVKRKPAKTTTTKKPVRVESDEDEDDEDDDYDLF